MTVVTHILPVDNEDFVRVSTSYDFTGSVEGRVHQG